MTGRLAGSMKIEGVVGAAISALLLASCGDPSPVASPQETHDTVTVPEIHWNAGDPRQTTDELSQLYFTYQTRAHRK